MFSSSESIRHGYSTIRVVVDDLRRRDVVIGVVAWDADAEWFSIRSLNNEERLPGINTHLRGFADVAVAQLQKWVRKGQVPYSSGPLHPWESHFWVAASRIMTTAVRLDLPRSMDPMKERDRELDLLFEALVQPVIAADRKQKRIDGVVTTALGRAATWFRRGLDMPAFSGRSETVLRGVVGTHGALIVEGVNLASMNARKDADALVSRLLRIKEGQATEVRFLVGYVASPGGLNGEADMRDWIRAKVTANVFDLVSEGSLFQTTAVDQLREVGLSPQL